MYKPLITLLGFLFAFLLAGSARSDDLTTSSKSLLISGSGFTGGTITTNLHLLDDIQLQFGDDVDYWQSYDSAGTQFEIWSADCDGIGTNCAWLRVQDGNDDVIFSGGLLVESLNALVGQVKAGAGFENTIVLTGNGGGLRAGSAGEVSWSSNTNGDLAAADIALQRASTGVLEITNGTGLGTAAALNVGSKFSIDATGTQSQDQLKTGLPDNVATAFVRISVPTNNHNGGQISYGVHADDGGDFQIINGIVTFSLLNDAGNEVCDVQEAAASQSTVGTAGNITATFTCANTVADTINILVTSNTTLVATTHEIHYQIFINEPATITPL